MDEKKEAKMNTGIDAVKRQLHDYKKKYYTDKLVKGVLYFLLVGLCLFLTFTVLEFNFRFGTWIRGFLLFSFVILTSGILLIRIIKPLWEIYSGGKNLDDAEAARQIGQFFPEVKDKLLNVLQLQKISNQDESLLIASIDQKSHELSTIKFVNAIKINANLSFLRYLAIPAGITLILLLLVPQLFTESAARIIQYNKTFTPPPPFTFNLLNESLDGFRNEDFQLKMSIEGDNIPENVYLESNGRRIKLNENAEGLFEFTFPKMLVKTNFKFEAAGYSSAEYQITLHNRPLLKNFNVFLDFPSYTGKQDVLLENIGNVEVPEGSQINWQFATTEADSLWLKFDKDDEPFSSQISDNQLFDVKKTFFDPQYYEVLLANKFSKNKDRIRYRIEVVKDKAPEIHAEIFQDTTLFSFIVLGGSVSDDYGLTKLAIKYQTQNAKEESLFSTLPLPLDKKQSSQGFYYQWRIDSMNLKEGETLAYYVEVTDNDEVNGHKSTRTGLYYMKVPTRKELKESLAKEAQGAEKQIDKSLDQAKEIQDQIKEIENRLKTKKKMDWQDEKLIQDLLDKKEQLSENIEKLKNQNKDLNERRERFSESSPKLKDQMEKLQSLMDELLDDETKKLYDELKKLLEEKSQLGEVQKMMNQIENKEENLEKELERALELFNKMKFDFKLEEIVQDLEETSKKQEELSEKTENSEKSKEDLIKEQEEIKEEFQELQKDMEELNELNQELNNPESMPDVGEEKEEVEKNQEESISNLEEQKRKKASDNQKKSAQQMKQMGEKMQQMQSNMEMEMLEENLDNLRDIVHNLVKLSFSQENLMNNFKEVNQSDPRFLELSQEQLKIKDDAIIVKDSLLALANRVFQIASFVTREVSALNEYMDQSLDALKDRNKSLAISKQQFSMTSMNNLALLLDDVLQQMQQQMADAMGSPQKGKKGQKKNMPGLSDLQSELSKKINDLKKSGKTGRQLSEELAKLAAEQEMIRRELEAMQQKMGGDKEGGPGGLQDAIKKMEQTERDLVNKRLANISQERQEDIVTRLLEAENSERERELSKEREGEAARDFERKIPAAFEEYKQLKEKEIELLKTVPPKLNPYYKKEVNEYFKRIGSN
ncbi:DUF4175 family protein [uncultured Imperialibacter sp.]|uniref:DUF4175 family protein n=1 Tax=uncultured Imperialibacter sp. TaxID=1672639 RepID=UPI0030DC474A|tara:strand:- start:118315 stop:121638 length:3324 start_codon:yes stop_codon:yes gene_type:complete